MKISEAIMNTGMQEVIDRMESFASKMNAAGIPYAIIGGNAVRAWMGTVGDNSLITTRDVDVMIRKEDLQQACEATGRIFRHFKRVDLLHEPGNTKVVEAIHLMFGEPESVDFQGVRVVTLERLVNLKLAANRPKDQSALIAMLDANLLDPQMDTDYPDRWEALVDAVDDMPEDFG